MESPMDNLLNGLLSSSDAATLLNCDVRTLRRYREKGIINRKKIKGIVYYTSEDIIKLKSIQESQGSQRKLEVRIKALEDQVASLKSQLKMLTKISGFTLGSGDLLNDTDVDRVRVMLKSFTNRKSVKWSVAHSWVKDVNSFSDDTIEKVGKDCVLEFLHKVATMCEIDGGDKAKSLELSIINKIANINLSGV
jgi:DNA-binding transcriptional MerR regulator